MIQQYLHTEEKLSSFIHTYTLLGSQTEFYIIQFLAYLLNNLRLQLMIQLIHIYIAKKNCRHLCTTFVWAKIYPPLCHTYVRTPLCRRKLAPLSQLLIHFIPCHAILEITQIMQQIKCIILILVFHETYTSYENEDQRRNSLNSIEYGKHYLILSSFASCVIYLVEPTDMKKCTCVIKEVYYLEPNHLLQLRC